MNMVREFLVSYIPSFPSDPAWWFFVLPNLIANAGAVVSALMGKDRMARILLQLACWFLVGFLILHTVALHRWAAWIKGVDLPTAAISLWRSPHGYLHATLYALLGACGLACLAALPARIISMAKSVSVPREAWAWTFLLLASAATLVWCRWELFRYSYPAIVHLGN
jgi:hypothetical protein